MEWKSNSLMSKLMGEGLHSSQRPSIEIPEPMLAILRNGFEENDGAVLPIGMDKNTGSPNDDETGRECLHNKTHIEDWAPESASVTDMVRLGMTYAERLKDSLQKSALQGLFRMIISARPTDCTCVMRFHRVRTGQAWLDMNLENYTEEAVMTMDFNVAHKQPNNTVQPKGKEKSND